MLPSVQNKLHTVLGDLCEVVVDPCLGSLVFEEADSSRVCTYPSCRGPCSGLYLDRRVVLPCMKECICPTCLEDVGHLVAWKP